MLIFQNITDCSTKRNDRNQNDHAKTNPALDRPACPACFCISLSGDDSFKSKQILPKPSNDGQWQQTAE